MAEHDARRGEAGDLLSRLRRLLAEDAAAWTEEALSRRLRPDARELGRALEALEEGGEVRRLDGGRVVSRRAEESASALPPAAESMEARLRLEPELAALAATRAGPAEIRRMRRFAAREMAATDPGAQELWGAALHRLIARAAGNALLLEAFDRIDARRAEGDWRRLATFFDWCDCGGMLGGCDHGAVVEAIAAGDPETAALVMRAHLLEVSGRVERAEASRRASEGHGAPREAARRQGRHG